LLEYNPAIYSFIAAFKSSEDRAYLNLEIQSIHIPLNILNEDM